MDGVSSVTNDWRGNAYINVQDADLLISIYIFPTRDRLRLNTVHYKQTPWHLVRKRTLPTERSQPVGEF
jgi:hypothetical protein